MNRDKWNMIKVLNFILLENQIEKRIRLVQKKYVKKKKKYLTFPKFVKRFKLTDSRRFGKSQTE